MFGVQKANDIGKRNSVKLLEGILSPNHVDIGGKMFSKEKKYDLNHFLQARLVMN